jgi:cysteinyl-tRNA synthetase
MIEHHPLVLFNSLTRQPEPFVPVHAGQARVYSCGPTVYNYPHIGNMRAYVFADVLGRTLSYKGYALTHVINITDVGHLTDDADAGQDKMEAAAAARAQSIWDIARHYTQAYWADVAALNIRPPAHWSIATEYVPQMIAFAQTIADRHCYELPGGLYFDIASVADYGLLARAHTEEGAGRIDEVEGKRHPADFAIWRKTPAGETRQMEWDSPWGRGAPGWHLECSVMSGALLGFPFDIHTGGIDHREIHHPNEIAQNQAFCCAGTLTDPANSGARVWMHNNFLVDRTGKMSKSSGEFLRLPLLIDRGYHPLAYRLMCLQAHYRSELEFSWEGLGASLTRLKRLVMAVAHLRDRAGAAVDQPGPRFAEALARFDAAISDDLNTAVALTVLDDIVAMKKVDPAQKLAAIGTIDAVLGLGLLTLDRVDLRLRPKAATIDEAAIATVLDQRRAARADKDFARSDALRDDLLAAGVDVMDGDPLGWDWRLTPGTTASGATASGATA